jgi:hypothetical protein
MTNTELANSIRCGLFAERENLKEAMDYAFRVFRSLDKGGEIAATTALFVVLNTLSNEMLKDIVPTKENA